MVWCGVAEPVVGGAVESVVGVAVEDGRGRRQGGSVDVRIEESPEC